MGIVSVRDHTLRDYSMKGKPKMSNIIRETHLGSGAGCGG